MKVTGYKDKSGYTHWCVHSPYGIIPFAEHKDTAIEVGGLSANCVASFGFGIISESEIAEWRKVASFIVEQRNE